MAIRYTKDQAKEAAGNGDTMASKYEGSSVTEHQIEDLIAFVTTTPPVVHNRESYRCACNDGCKACAYMRMRYRAVDAVVALRRFVDANHKTDS